MKKKKSMRKKKNSSPFRKIAQKPTRQTHAHHWTYNIEKRVGMHVTLNACEIREIELVVDQIFQGVQLLEREFHGRQARRVSWRCRKQRDDEDVNHHRGRTKKTNLTPKNRSRGAFIHLSAQYP